jgi:hypothetical protein
VGCSRKKRWSLGTAEAHAHALAQAALHDEAIAEMVEEVRRIGEVAAWHRHMAIELRRRADRLAWLAGER